MKILHINHSDISGGAAKAAYRLHRGLLMAGLDSRYLVVHKKCDDYTIIGPQSKFKKALMQIYPILDNLFLRFYRSRKRVTFSSALFPTNTHKVISRIEPDIVHLHWIAGGSVSIKEIAKTKKPIVWTLHDMWAFTGGCHYSEGCERYTKGCGKCPILGSEKQNDLSYRVWKRKKRFWRNLNLTVVTPSYWLGKCAKESSLFHNVRVEVIPNGLETDIYKPIDKNITRDILSLPKDKKLILFGALSATSDKRKGFRELSLALRMLYDNGLRNIEVIILGSSRPQDAPDFGFKSYYIGHLCDDISLSVLYSAVDVVVVPSMQDNLPNAVMESLACGIPVVAFDVGGIHDMVDHQKNGYLAKSYSVRDLANGIKWVVEDGQRWKILSGKAREKTLQAFKLKNITKSYLDIYREVLRNS